MFVIYKIIPNIE